MPHTDPHPAPILRRTATLFLAVLVAIGVTSGIAGARVVNDVSIQYIGAETVDRSVLLSQIQTKVGSQLDATVIEEDIRSLYESGHVDNVRVLNEDLNGGARVIYLVQTRATLGEVVFMGNSLPATKLRKETELDIGKPFDDGQLETARLNVSDYYIKKGYANAGVTYKIDASEQPGFSRVTFIIDEGTREQLNTVRFYGNEAISDRELENQLEMKAAKAFNIFKRNKGIDTSLLESDVIRIEEHYRNNGYLNARVVDVQREPVGEKVDLVITISEGEKYSINSVNATGIKAVDQTQVLAGLQMQPGSVYSSSGIKADIKDLRAYYGNNGYSNARIMPRITSAGGTMVDINYEVAEGVQTSIELINISGNDKTQDKVIRRELALEPGDTFSQDNLEVSRNRLMGLGFFEGVDISPTAAASPYATDINIDVREKSTGSVNFGAGFSSIDNLVGFVDLVQTNFRGTGRKVRVSAKIGTRRKDLAVDFTEPWLFDQKLALSVGAYYRDLLFLSDKYDLTKVGGYASLRKSVGEHSYLTGKLTGENIDIAVDNDASEELQEENGDYTRGIAALTYVYDTRDSQLLTRSGVRLSAGLEASFGDISNVALDLQGAKFVQTPLDGIFTLSGRFRTVSGDTPIVDRVFLGGANDLKGYGYREAAGGLRDEQGEPLGGSSAAYFTLEQSFPVFDMKKVRMHAFYDGGLLSRDSWDFGGSYLSDVGLGVDLYLPVGPIRVDVAFPLQKDEFTDDWRIQFNMGYRF